jgi:hypothetical protein
LSFHSNSRRNGRETGHAGLHEKQLSAISFQFLPVSWYRPSGQRPIPSIERQKTES